MAESDCARHSFAAVSLRVGHCGMRQDFPIHLAHTGTAHCFVLQPRPSCKGELSVILRLEKRGNLGLRAIVSPLLVRDAGMILYRTTQRHLTSANTPLRRQI